MIQKTASRTALITGASAGIGRDFARLLASEGHNLVITARREERLRTLADELKTNYDVSILIIVADLSKPTAADFLANEIANHNIQIDVLVNNAGYGVKNTYQKVSWKTQMEMLQTMLLTPTQLCNIYAPQMAERGFGQIINIASVAAFLPGVRNVALYAPIKAFIARLSQDMTIEYRRKGVSIVGVCPGFTLSEFHDANDTRREVERLPNFLWLSGTDVARSAYHAVKYGRGPIVINGLIYKLLVAILKPIPENWLVRMLAPAPPRTAQSTVSPSRARQKNTPSITAQKKPKPKTRKSHATPASKIAAKTNTPKTKATATKKSRQKRKSSAKDT